MELLQQAYLIGLGFATAISVILLLCTLRGAMKHKMLKDDGIGLVFFALALSTLFWPLAAPVVIALLITAKRRTKKQPPDEPVDEEPSRNHFYPHET